MSLTLLWLLLPVAALSGYLAAKKSARGTSSWQKNLSSSKDYLTGLNFLLNEQPDKALELFIKLLEVDSDTIETHFALGSLFRRRGEVDRAIRIHQNLIARPDLSRANRLQALLELGHDYMRAGVLDRAETLFQELVGLKAHMRLSLQCLIDIYQQERDWDKAINTAIQFERYTNESMASLIAHYYCELAEVALDQAQPEQMNRYLKQALNADPKSVRTQLLQARQAYDAKDYKLAISHYQRVKLKNPEFTAEILLPMARCYEACGQAEQFNAFLQRCLQEELGAEICATFSSQLSQYITDPHDINTIAEQLQKRPSARAIYTLIELRFKESSGEEARHLMLLRDIVRQLLGKEAAYYCENCGFSAQALYWLCPSCKHWDMIKPFSGFRVTVEALPHTPAALD
ncbi:MAG: lipopolysaccharide assembly protein LapB [Legionellales bacterium]